MGVPAWCGTCGLGFDLAQVVTAGAAGRCPRCGTVFAPGYGALFADAVRTLIDARAAEQEALATLADVAPRLHVAPTDDTATHRRPA
jgi:hypothetical protein